MMSYTTNNANPTHLPNSQIGTAKIDKNLTKVLSYPKYMKKEKAKNSEKYKVLSTTT